MKISKHNRRVAIRICAIAASTPGFAVDYGWSHINGASDAGFDPALAAWIRSRGVTPAEAWAEAEARLRTGWCP